MGKEIKVSICVITFNHSSFIKDMVEGFLSQKFDFNVELIISDDDSTDGTYKEILKYIDLLKEKFDVRINLNKERLGIINNFFQTIKSCNGQYIALCEGDDYWIYSEKLNRQVNFLDGNAEYVATFHNSIVKNEINPASIKKTYFSEDWMKTGSLQNFFFIEELGASFPTCSLFFRNINDYVYEFSYPVYGGDNVLILNLLQFGKVFYMNEVLSVYRLHGNGSYGEIVSKSLAKTDIYKSNVFLLLFFSKYYSGDKQEFKNAISKYSRLIIFDNSGFSFGKIQFMKRLVLKDIISLFHILINKIKS